MISFIGYMMAPSVTDAFTLMEQRAGEDDKYFGGTDIPLEFDSPEKAAAFAKENRAYAFQSGLRSAVVSHLRWSYGTYTVGQTVKKVTLIGDPILN